MDRSQLRRLLKVDVDAVLADLTTRQYVRPHAPVADALRASATQLGLCPDAAARSLKWLDIHPEKSVGRLRRTEIMQLARSVHRFCRQREAIASPANTELSANVEQNQAFTA